VVTTAAQNRRLTEVGPGTPMGDLLRRHWQPIAAEAEFSHRPAKAVRLLGEDWVLYRTTSGQFGLIEPHCLHRRAGLVNGYPEDDGIRCSYHGWKYDLDGRCIERPFEEVAAPTPRRPALCAIAGRAEGRHGLVWAYLGPEPAPLIPTWEPFTYPNCFKQILFHIVECNWLQCQENAIDPVHFEWLHNNWRAGRSGHHEDYSPAHVELGFEEWEHGFVYRRLHTGEDKSSDSWTTGRLCIVPNLFAPLHFEWRVPIDDHHTLSVVWVFDRVPAEREPYEQDVIPYWWGRTHDDAGEPLTSHVLHQDILSWTGQGPLTDRTEEHLGRSDRGVMLLRRRLEADMAAVERGEDPSGLVRDPVRNECIAFPNDVRGQFLSGPSVEQIRQRGRQLHRALPALPPDDHFFLMAGQPEPVRHEWEYAMGLREDHG
jgi:5,5'-dehydrodivanillate O-demethylase